MIKAQSPLEYEDLFDQDDGSIISVFVLIAGEFHNYTYPNTIVVPYMLTKTSR